MNLKVVVGRKGREARRTVDLQAKVMVHRTDHVQKLPPLCMVGQMVTISLRCHPMVCLIDIKYS